MSAFLLTIGRASPWRVTNEEVVSLAKGRQVLLRNAYGALTRYREYSDELARLHPTSDERSDVTVFLRSSHEKYSSAVAELRAALKDVGIPTTSQLPHAGVLETVDVITEALFTEKWAWQAWSCALGLVNQGVGPWAAIEKDPARYPTPPLPASEAEIEARIRPSIEASVRAEILGKYKRRAIAVVSFLGASTIIAIVSALLYFFRAEAREEARKLDAQGRLERDKNAVAFQQQTLAILKEIREREHTNTEHGQQGQQNQIGQQHVPSGLTSAAALPSSSP